MTVNGVSEPKDWAMAIAMAVLPKRKFSFLQQNLPKI
jgi:hypothetical protein